MIVVRPVFILDIVINSLWSIQIMAFYAELEVAVHIHSLKSTLFKNHGLVRFKVALSHRLPNLQGKVIRASPYEFMTRIGEPQWTPSYINKEECVYTTRGYAIKPSKQDYLVDEICIFRADVPMQFIEDLESHCSAELMYSPDITSNHNEFQSLASYQGRISRISKISDYFCMSFDDFQGFKINAGYNATILQFKFVQGHTVSHKMFAEYLQACTYGFLKQETKTFYMFYKRAMEEEISFLREKLEVLLNIQTPIQSLNTRRSKVVPVQNMKVQLELEQLTNVQTGINNPLVKRLLDAILEDSTLMKKECLQIWRKYLGALLQYSQRFISQGQARYEMASNERLKCHVFSHEIKSFDPTESKYQNVGEQHLKQAINEKRKFIKEASPYQFHIQNLKYYPVEDKAPKLFEEIYYTSRKPLEQHNSTYCVHVFILVHGFQASRKDMELFRVTLETSVPNCQIMVSCYNQGKTESSIKTLAHNFGTEVAGYLGSLGKSDYKVSFVGHSMGGIIIRAGLHYLSQYFSKFWSYVSLSSPHLGYLQHSSQLVNAGLWYLNKWEKCQSISELAMADSPSLQTTFLYQLSKDLSMGHFQNVAFVSSYQDSYVSFESARVEKTSKTIDGALRKDNSCRVLCEMSQNIINSLHCVKFSRIDVIFDIKQNNLDSLIGRTAHVKLLSDKGFVKILVNVFGHIFK